MCSHVLQKENFDHLWPTNSADQLQPKRHTKRVILGGPLFHTIKLFNMQSRNRWCNQTMAFHGYSHNITQYHTMIFVGYHRISALHCFTRHCPWTSALLGFLPQIVLRPASISVQHLISANLKIFHEIPWGFCSSDTLCSSLLPLLLINTTRGVPGIRTIRMLTVAAVTYW